jgi:hypothetical protein
MSTIKLGITRVGRHSTLQNKRVARLLSLVDIHSASRSGNFSSDCEHCFRESAKAESDKIELKTNQVGKLVQLTQVSKALIALTVRTNSEELKAV